MSTTSPYLSKRGKRSSAVVPARHARGGLGQPPIGAVPRGEGKSAVEMRRENLRKVMLRTRRE